MRLVSFFSFFLSFFLTQQFGGSVYVVYILRLRDHSLKSHRASRITVRVKAQTGLRLGSNLPVCIFDRRATAWSPTLQLHSGSLTNVMRSTTVAGSLSPSTAWWCYHLLSNSVLHVSKHDPQDGQLMVKFRLWCFIQWWSQPIPCLLPGQSLCILFSHSNWLNLTTFINLLFVHPRELPTASSNLGIFLLIHSLHMSKPSFSGLSSFTSQMCNMRLSILLTPIVKLSSFISTTSIVKPAA